MQPSNSRRFRRRVKLLMLGLVVGLMLVVARVADLQLNRHEEFARLAKEQYLKEVRIPAIRGNIYDREGKPLAVSVDVPSVYANPQQVIDPRQAARVLAPVVGMDLHRLYARLASDRLFVWVKRQVSPQMAERVRSLEVAGIGSVTESRRFYPNREIAGQVIGFAGVDANGLEGTERILEQELAGEPQVVPALRDGRGKSVLAEGLQSIERSRGADVYLHLDLQIQHAAEVALNRARTRTRARGGMAVVLEVATGAVLAMAVVPQFNPNRASATPASHRRNRAVTDIFEPGSALKPLVVAGALEQGVIKPEELFFCDHGALVIGSHTIRDTKPHGWLSVVQVVERSSNIGAAKIGAKLGPAHVAKTLRDFGLGVRTRIRLPAETPGALRDPKGWSALEAATISFGHGVAVSALQLAAAYGALASGGIYRPPRLVRIIRGSEGEQGVEPRGQTRRILSQKITAAVAKMLEAAAGAEGTGSRAQVPGYRVAGKTGTAHKVDLLAGGGYSPDKFVAVFAGFLPSQAPQAVIVVAIDEPQTEHTGGEVAAPVFAEIGAAVMQQLGVLPSPTALARQASPAKSQPDPPAPPVRPTQATAPGAVPSFIGLTAREAVTLHSKAGVPGSLLLRGSGRVVKQDPAPGADRADLTRMSLVLRHEKR